MTVDLFVRNKSKRKRLYRTDVLRRLAETVCKGEGFQGDCQLSLLLCDDPFIQDLNRRYRKEDRPTDVLSFRQDNPGFDASDRGHPEVLGDIVISLEAVERHCAKAAPKGAPDTGSMRQEVRLLFCHGLLHLLGVHHHTEDARREMNAKQARYLGITKEAAWRSA